MFRAHADLAARGPVFIAAGQRDPKRNGWTIAQQVADRTPDRTQRLLNRAVWDGQAAMSQMRRFVVTGLDAVAGRRTRRGLRIAALDETGQQKAGTATCGVKRQYMGCAGGCCTGRDQEAVEAAVAQLVQRRFVDVV